jgi:hypothetical protein
VCSVFMCHTQYFDMLSSYTVILDGYACVDVVLLLVCVSFA